MSGDPRQVGRLLQSLAAEARTAARGRPGPAEPVDVADQLQDVLALQHRTTAQAARFNQAPPGQPAARTGALVCAWAAARLGLVGAVLGEALEAAAHLWDPGAAALDPRQLDALEGVVAREVDRARRGLHALSADLHTVGEAVSAGPPWPTVPLPAALAAAPGAAVPPAAGEHEPRAGAARQRTRHLLAVVAPPAPTPGTGPPPATVLPFRRT